MDAEPKRAPVRVGVLLDSMRAPLWVKDTIVAMRTSRCVTMALVITIDGFSARRAGGARERPRGLARLASWRWRRAYALYSRLDAMISPVRPDPLELISLEPLLADCPIIDLAPHASHGGDIDEAAAEHVRSCRLDVLVQLGTQIPDDRVLPLARYGVWTCRPLDAGASLEVPPGLCEVVRGESVTAVTLRMLTPGSAGSGVIAQSLIRTRRRSAGRNRQHYLRRASALITRGLRDLYELGPESLTSEAPAAASILPPARATCATAVPASAEMLASLVRTGGAYARRRLTRLASLEQWFLAYHFHDGTPGPDHVPHTAFREFTHIVPPRDRFWADPFPVYEDGRYHVFVEELPYASDKGHIAVIELCRDGTWTVPVAVLQRPYHLSYPFVFRWRGEYLMCPESHAGGSIELYRAASFPYEWKHHATLLEGVSCADPTFIELDGRWWMFVTMAHKDATDLSYLDDELYLFYAPTPLGPWKPHPRNPVKSNVRSARPAGRLFWRGGALYRPAQDCSTRYGYGMTLNRVVRIDPTGFHEVAVESFPPRWAANLVGTHTMNAECGLTVIDGRARRRRVGMAP